MLWNSVHVHLITHPITRYKKPKHNQTNLTRCMQNYPHWSNCLYSVWEDTPDIRMDLSHFFHFIHFRVVSLPFAWGLLNFVSIKKTTLPNSHEICEHTKNTASCDQNKADRIKSEANAVTARNKRKEREREKTKQDVWEINKYVLLFCFNRKLRRKEKKRREKASWRRSQKEWRKNQMRTTN